MLGWYVRTAIGLSFDVPGGGRLLGPMLNVAHRVAHHLGLAIVGTIVGGLATFVHVNRRTALAARRRQHAAERARGQARRRTLESQLQALQARVEPMFLFDTLEHIRALYRSDAARGRRDAGGPDRLPARGAAAPARVVVDRRAGAAAGARVAGHRRPHGAGAARSTFDVADGVPATRACPRW